MKKLLYMLILLVLVMMIYNNYSKQQKIVLTFGDGYYGNYNYVYDDTKITDLINDIKYNKKLENRYLQNILIKSSTVYLNLNNLFNYDSYEKIMVNINDLENLIVLMKKYCKEQIIIQLLDGDSEYSYYANKKIRLSLEKYDIIFVR